MRALPLVLLAACYSPEARQWTTDAPATVTLVVTITGSGHVTIGDLGTCSEPRCSYTVPASQRIELDANAVKEDHPFAQWSMSCTGTDSTCSLTPVMSPTQVGAKFQ
jgi:hypothetical protein